jgi:hypothetical protein
MPFNSIGVRSSSFFCALPLLGSVYRSERPSAVAPVILFDSAKRAAAALDFDLPRTGARQPWNKALFRVFTQAPSVRI